MNFSCGFICVGFSRALPPAGSCEKQMDWNEEPFTGLIDSRGVRFMLPPGQTLKNIYNSDAYELRLSLNALSIKVSFGFSEIYPRNLFVFN